MSEARHPAASVADGLAAMGRKSVLIETSHPQLKWVLVAVPVLKDLSVYTLTSQKDGPLVAAVHLFQTSFLAGPDGVDVNSVILAQPFVALRVIQALLQDLGLGTVAQKKSLV